MNVLAFFAHPDDETMMIGGTLALLARQAVKVHYLCATRGEGGELGEPAVCTREEIGEMRERELRCAVEQLGGASLSFLDYIDPLVGPGDELYAFASDLEEVADRLFHYLSDQKIDFILSHGSNGEYGHPAHLLVYQAVGEVIRRFGDDAPVWYSVHASHSGHPRPQSMNRDDQAHIIVDVSLTYEEKVRAALCHRSQHALFIRRRSEEAGRRLEVPETIQRVESLHRAWPPTPGRPDDPLAEILLASGAGRLHGPEVG